MEKVTLGVIIFAFAVWAAKEIYSSMRNETKENTKVTQTNTLAVSRLEVKIEGFEKTLERFTTVVGKLEKDVNAIHAKLRQKGGEV